MALGKIAPDGRADFLGPVLVEPQERGGWVAKALERMRRQHLHRHGNYARLRRLLPVPALALVWMQAMHYSIGWDFNALINSSITLRHLFLGVGAVLVWQLLSASRPKAASRPRADLEAEATLLMRSSIGSALFVYLGCIGHLSEFANAELSACLAGVLLIESVILLLVTFTVAGFSDRFPGRERRALIIGSGSRATALRRLAESIHSRLEVFGCLDNQYSGSDAEQDNYLGKLALLPEVLKAHPIEIVLISLPVKSHYAEIERAISVCENIGVECHYMCDIFSTSRMTLQQSSAPEELAVLGDRPQDARHWIKRTIDIAIAGSIFVAALPVMALIALAIKLTSTGPVFFVQQRYGYNRRLFPMFKFRTMVVDAEKRQSELESANEAGGPVFKLKSDPRVTRIGAILRRTSLDELPQLINVLRGEMSLVGPRPLPLRDVSRFDEPWLLRRFSVMPGLTCLWQVGGRSNTKFEEWIKLDLQYIDQWSLALDFKILMLTIPAVFRGSGAM
jgi:exopolysaccharide biosynthesis polyprenyl glycosylphosphotransferase